MAESPGSAVRPRFSTQFFTMKYITLEEFCTCSQTYQHYSDQIDPYPWQPESIEAIEKLCFHILDPIIDHFGQSNFNLTYGFCSVDLKKFLSVRRNQTCTKVDQHCAHEVNSKGKLICDRLGAAADFRIDQLDSSDLIRWIASIKKLPFDSIYFYSDSRPIHISYGPQQKRSIWGFRPDGTPRRLTKDNF